MFRVSRSTTPEIGVQVEADMGERDVGKDQAEEDMVKVGLADMQEAEVMAIQLVEGEDISRVREVNGKEDVGMGDMEDQIRVVKHSCKSTQL